MPRKTRADVDVGPLGDRASMRPRPDAAENASPRLHAGRGQLASMRPRPDAAENIVAMSSAARGLRGLQ